MQKYMKKTGIFGLVLALAFIAATMTTTLTANAATVYDDMDTLFRSTLNDIFDYEKADDATVSARKQTLYDIRLNELGVLYDFTETVEYTYRSETKYNILSSIPTYNACGYKRLRRGSGSEYYRLLRQDLYEFNPELRTRQDYIRQVPL